MNGTTIDIKTSDGQFSAWLTRPPQQSAPTLILLQEIFGTNDFMRKAATQFAEEGYNCLIPDLYWRLQADTDLPYEAFDEAMALRNRFDLEAGVADIGAVMSAAAALPGHAGQIGIVGYCMGGMLAVLAAAAHRPAVMVAYYPTNLPDYLPQLQQIECPATIHLGEIDDKVPPADIEAITSSCAGKANIKVHRYPDCGHAFANPARPNYNKPATMMAYSATLANLRRNLGPMFDLSDLWDKHTEYEFASRDVDATMQTMVRQPYVNHVPTMTGGVGHDHLKRFYKYHFVNSNPPDTRLIPVSRTIGADRVVDEMIFCFTHSCEIPWMLPGVKPTGKYVEIPLVAIVNFRGDKLYHEHIYWDQASVLVQIGVLSANGLPVAGIETAKKLIDETLPSNEMMAVWAESEGKPL